ncbi:MAG: phosphoribosyltransferase family protein [Rhodobacteraceae bacterium]|nr:phosphoribosyltransferase family protein [Paracoccaceae bacterium]
MFRDRAEAGRRLAGALAPLALRDPVVLALPRGGVPVAAEIAARLKAPLDLILVRKLGVPGQEELAAGAVAEGAVVFNPGVLAALGRTEADFAAAVAARRAEIERRRALFLGGRAPADVAGRTAIVVDDGIATGATARAALACLRARGAAAVVLAVPVAAPDSLEALAPLADRIVCLERPADFRAVGLHYADFTQVGDEEVIAILDRFAGRPEGRAGRQGEAGR